MRAPVFASTVMRATIFGTLCSSIFQSCLFERLQRRSNSQTESPDRIITKFVRFSPSSSWPNLCLVKIMGSKRFVRQTRKINMIDKDLMTKKVDRYKKKVKFFSNKPYKTWPFYTNCTNYCRCLIQRGYNTLWISIDLAFKQT